MNMISFTEISGDGDTVRRDYRVFSVGHTVEKPWDMSRNNYVHTPQKPSWKYHGMKPQRLEEGVQYEWGMAWKDVLEMF